LLIHLAKPNQNHLHHHIISYFHINLIILVLYASNLTSPCGFDTFFITTTYSCTWKCFTCFFDNLDSHILLLSTRFLIKMYLLGATCIARTMRPYMGCPLTMGLRVCHPAGWVVDRRSGLSRRQRISLIVDFNGHFLYF
jgi:hypothetical protein